MSGLTDGWAERVGAVLGLDVADDYGTARVDVAASRWEDAVRAARDGLGCTFFDWLTAVDELPDGFRLVCHLARPPAADQPLRRLLLRTQLPRESPSVATVVGVFAGAAWHEREVREMFGVGFSGAEDSGAVQRLLLPEGFAGNPLRKDFVLASRVDTAWPGAKEPGESDATLAEQRAAGRRPRRRSRPPGVPDPDEPAARGGRP